VDFIYPANVRFACNFCGLCCGDTAHKERHVLVLKSEAEDIACRTSKSISDFSVRIDDRLPYVYEMKKTEEGKCVFLADNKCLIYDSRPLICMFYPFELRFGGKGEPYVFSFTAECPGVGEGKVWRLKDFKKLFESAKERIR